MPSDDLEAPIPIAITTRHITLPGDLTLPPDATGIVVFVHGSGSSRLSPRNRRVAESLARDGFATLLFDLLTAEEEVAERYTRHLRFDIDLLSRRLVDVLEWVGEEPTLGRLPIGLFGASTGAAAALIAATEVPQVRAVVSRGGRPDLADAALLRVTCPTLLIVGGDDLDVLELNRRAQRRLKSLTKLHIVPRAGHLFEEPGALDEVTAVAAEWFHEHLVLRRPDVPRHVYGPP